MFRSVRLSPRAVFHGSLRLFTLLSVSGYFSSKNYLNVSMRAHMAPEELELMGACSSAFFQKFFHQFY
jgi:hypothetical protein